MKKNFLIAFFTLFFSFCATAQYSLGVNTYYNIGSNFKGIENQFAFGVAASAQLSSYFDTQLKLISVFSKETNTAGISSFPFQEYEHTPSSAEVSYTIRLRPVVNKNQERITLGTGVLYRYLYRPSRTTPSGVFLVSTPNLNRVIGIPVNIGLEFDLNDQFTLSLEQENRFFLRRENKTLGDPGFNVRYHGVSLNLMHHPFAKKTI